MSEIYDLTRAYYAYLVRTLKKENCTVSIYYGEDITHRHEIIDALLFDGAHIYDCGNTPIESDGSIDISNGIFDGVELDILKEIVESQSFEHQNNAQMKKAF